MHVISTLAVLSAAILPCLAQSGNVRVTYDNTYDDASWPLSGTACSNGANGLENRWPTLGNVPNFPNLGGIPGLTWNSPLCGTCWQLVYTAPDGTISNINVTAVDAAGTFNIAEEAFSKLAGSAGVAKGAVNAVAKQVSTKSCGF